jgi:hypothetical protein
MPSAVPLIVRSITGEACFGHGARFPDQSRFARHNRAPSDFKASLARPTC